MESPLSPGLSLRPEEAWGEWAPRRDGASSVLPARGGGARRSRAWGARAAPVRAVTGRRVWEAVRVREGERRGARPPRRLRPPVACAPGPCGASGPAGGEPCGGREPAELSCPPVPHAPRIAPWASVRTGGAQGPGGPAASRPYSLAPQFGGTQADPHLFPVDPHSRQQEWSLGSTS